MRWNRRKATEELQETSEDLRKQLMASAEKLDDFARALALEVDHVEGDEYERQ